ncbi:MAG: LysR family transcriptional regulator [Pseudomonadota bacterium]
MSSEAILDPGTWLSPAYYSDCAIFAQVAQTLSYRAAGEALGISRSSVSKRIVALEQSLGVVLLNRSTRRISLTESGHKLLEHWREVERVARASYDAVHGSDLEPAGSLRISIASSLAAVLMPGLIHEFLKDWPDINLNMHFGEVMVDLVGQGYDVVIRVAEQLSDSVLLSKRLATTQRVLAASPKYLAEHGAPRRVQDLREHRTLGMFRGAQRQMNWRFEQGKRPVEIALTPAFTANADLALVLAACLDYGILYLPKLLIDSELRRERLQIIDIEDGAGPEVGVFALYPHREPPAKVRVFVDFVGQQIGTLDHLDRWRPLKKG